MRKDGRAFDQLRPVSIEPNPSAFAEGSALIHMGQTTVLCTLTIDESVPRWMYTQGKPGGWLTSEYAMLPRATQQRTERETRGIGGRTHEIRRLVGRSLRAAVDLVRLGPRTCILDCDVLQADGGTRTAAITGAYVALVLGLRPLIAAGKIPAETLLSPVAAVSVGVVDGAPILDLCYTEDSTASVDANVVMNAAGEYIEVQATAEGRPFSPQDLNQMLALANQGIHELLDVQRRVLESL